MPQQRIGELPLHTSTTIGNTTVTCTDANHCPGAVMIAFETRGRPPVLHSGDCRFDAQRFQGCPLLCRLRGRAILHLDTTYCSPQHCFPLQCDVVANVAALCRGEWDACRAAGRRPPLLVFGSYTIGKERIFLEVRGCEVGAACIAAQCACPKATLREFAARSSKRLHLQILVLTGCCFGRSTIP